MTRDLTLRLVPVKNIRAHPVRAAIILVLALAQAACVFVGFVALDGMRAQLSLAERRLGADLVVYPTTCLNQVDKRQLSMLGTPAQCDQPRAALSRMDANEDISAVTVQLAIADTQPDGTPLWIVGYDPATDFVISPWIAEGEGAAPPTGTVAVGAAVRQDPDGQVTLFGKQWSVGAHLEATGTDTDTIVFVTMDTLRQVIAASTESGVDTYASPEPRPGLHGRPRAGRQSERRRRSDRVDQPLRAQSDRRALRCRRRRHGLGRERPPKCSPRCPRCRLADPARRPHGRSSHPHERRRHEIFVWRSIGASRATIARVMTAESLIVHAAGALAGVVVGAAALPLLGDAPTLAALTTPARSAPLALMTVALLVAFGVAGTRLALARVSRAAQGNKLAPI